VALAWVKNNCRAAFLKDLTVTCRYLKQAGRQFTHAIRPLYWWRPPASGLEPA